MEENNIIDNKGPLLFLLHASIVFLLFIILTYWCLYSKYSNQGGGDIARWVFQGVVYFIQLIFIIVIHIKKVLIKKKSYINYSFWGATIVFIIVFLIEVSYNGGMNSLFY